MTSLVGNSNRLLIVDDDRDVSEIIRSWAEIFGFDVLIVNDPRGLYAALDAFQPTVIILDLMIPEMDGIKLMGSLAERRCPAHILLISGTEINIIHSAQRIGHAHGLRMAGLFQKPISATDLEAKLKQVMSDGPCITASALRDAIDLGKIVNYYQPRATLKKGDNLVVERVEAFVRWQHPYYGLVMPDSFMPLAEQAGLTGALAIRVLRDAIHQVSMWRELGLNLSVAVKIPAQLLMMRDLPDRIGAYLRQSEVDSSNLVLELRESEAMADTALTMEILTRLRLKIFGSRSTTSVLDSPLWSSCAGCPSMN